MPSYGKIAREGVFWLYFRQAFVMAAGIPTAVILARLLTPHDFGVAAAAAFFARLAGRLTRAGLNLALIRMREIEPAHVSSVFAFNLVTSVAMAGALVAGAPWLGGFVNSAEVTVVLPFAAVPFVLSSLGAVPLSLLRRDMRWKEVAAIQAANTITEATTAIALAWLGLGYWAIIIGLIAANVVSNAWAVRQARWRPSLRTSRAAFRDLFSFGFGTYVTRLLEYAAQNVDNLVVARVLGVTALGYYDKAFSTMDRAIGRINAAGPGVTFRIFALINEEPERFRRGYRKVSMSAGLLGFPFFAFMAATAPQLVIVLFGPQWTPTIVPFQLLCAAGVLKLLNEYVSSATQALGWVWSEVRRQLLYLVLIVVGIVLARPWGISGAALAVLCATVVMFVMMQAMLRRAGRLAVRDLWEPQVPAVLAAAAIVVLALATKAAVLRGLPGADLWAILAAQAAVAVVFFPVYLWFVPFGAVRELLHESLSDYAPRLARRMGVDVDAFTARAPESERKKARRAARAGMGTDALPDGRRGPMGEGVE